MIIIIMMYCSVLDVSTCMMMPTYATCYLFIADGAGRVRKKIWWQVVCYVGGWAGPFGKENLEILAPLRYVVLVMRADIGGGA